MEMYARVPDPLAVDEPEPLFATEAAYIEKELDLEAVLDTIVDQGTKQLRDLKLDDRDFPEFANIADFIMKENGLNIMPFSRQLWMLVVLFHEYCPDCTKKKKWMQNIMNMPLDLDPKEFGKHVQLLEHGKCPKCSKDKLDFFREKKLNAYQELDALLGQRVGKCVSGDTRVLTTKGMLRIDSFFDAQPLGFSDYDGAIRSVQAKGSSSKINKLYRARAQRLIKVDTASGHQITGTKSHPLLTVAGASEYTTLARMVLGDVVPVTVGQNKWALSAPSLAFAKVAAQKAFEKVVANNRVWPKLALSFTPEMAVALGYYVSEGSYTNYRVYNNDLQVIEECLTGISALLGEARSTSADGTRHYVTVGTSVAARAYMDAILGDTAGANSAFKAVPEIVFQSPRAHVIAFLSALFEGDGCTNGKVVQYTTISHQLALDVHHLLSNLGIISRVKHTRFRHQFKTSDRRAYYHVYNVSIEGVDQISAFQDTIGFRSERKRKMLSDMVTRQLQSRVTAQQTQSVQPAWYEKAPTKMGDLWKQEVLQLLSNHRLVIKSATPEYDYFRRGRDTTLAVSKQRVLKLDSMRSALGLKSPRSAVYDTMLEWASTPNLYFTEVVSIKLVPSAPTYDFEVDGTHQFMGNGLVNHNSTMLVSPCAAYLLHKYLKMPRPWAVFGLNPTTLFSTVVAQTYAAASDQLWLPIKTYIEDSKWFVEYHKLLTDVGLRRGEELFNFTTTQLYYKHRALMIYPSGPNRKTLRGKTRFFAATDEFDFFDGSENSDAVKMNGKEVRTSLNNSLASVGIPWRKKVIKQRRLVNVASSYSMYVSSPDHAMGVLTQLVKQKENSTTQLALNLATWEIHPDLTRRAIIQAFDPDPIRLERDFGARPPLNSNPFIEDPETIAKLADDGRINRVDITVRTSIVAEKLHLHPEITKMSVPQRMKSTVLALDAGYSNNSFAMAVIGPPLNSSAHTKAIIHALVEVMPPNGKGKINFHSVYEKLIKPIILQLNVRAVLADRWNSLKLLHDAAAEFDIHTDQYSLKYPDFMFVRSYLESGAVDIPRFQMDEKHRLTPDLSKYPECFRDAPVDHFAFQAVTVRDLHKTVDKGLGLTDDLWRAAVLGLRWVLDEEFAEKYLRASFARRAAGGIAAGTSMGRVQVQGHGIHTVQPSLNDILNASGVAAGTGGGMVRGTVPGSGETFSVASGTFARRVQ
jgi:intein/homing endonuclease